MRILMHFHSNRFAYAPLCFLAMFFILWTGGPAAAQVPSSSHVVIVIEENTSYSTVTNPNGSKDNQPPGSGYMPWLVGEGNMFGHAVSYFTDSGGSLLDYLWLSSGSCHTDNTTCAPSTLPANTHQFGCSGDSCSSLITDNNIFREMINNNISWKVYAE